ncbi:MAG: hypothetical protein QXF67_04375, partial [Candidatus Anstonellales archaeon]
MKIAWWTAILLLFISGCVSNSGKNNLYFEDCKGYFSYFYVEGIKFEDVYQEAKNTGVALISQNTKVEEFRASGDYCPGAKGGKSNLVEKGTYCEYSEDGRTYVKNYRFFEFEEKSEVESYTFFVYETCSGRLKVSVAYVGSCRNETALRAQIRK